MKRTFTFVAFIFLCTQAFSQTWVPKQANNDTIIYAGTFAIPELSKAYMINGSYFGNFNQALVYDTLTDSWGQIASYPDCFSYAMIGFSINGKGYLATGGVQNSPCNGSYYSNKLYEYDPIANTWTAKAPMPGQPRNAPVGFVIGGKGYVGGGATDTVPTTPQYSNGLTDFYAYDPATNTWAKVADCPSTSVNDGAEAFSIGNKGYVVTGGTLIGCCNYQPQADLWEYDPSTNGWTKKTDFPGGGRGFAAAFATCSMGYVMGGQATTSGYGTPNDFYQYNPSTDTWTQLPNFPGSGRMGAVSFAFGNSAFVGFGFNLSGSFAITRLHDFWEYRLPGTTSNAVAGMSSTLPDVCEGQSITFNDTSSFGSTSRVWNFQGGNPAVSTDKNPVIEFDTAGTYNVVLTALSGCNAATDTFKQYVTVNAAPTLSITPPAASVCSGKSIHLSVSGGGANYNWSPVAGLSATTGNAVTATTDTTITYTVMSASGGCTGSEQITITIQGSDTAGNITAVRDTICQGTPGNLILTGNTSNTIQWQSSITQGNFANAITDTTRYKTPPLSQSTYYRVVVGTGSCADTSGSFELFVPPALVATFNFSESGSTLTFDSDSSSGKIVTYHWDFGDGSTSTDKNPVHSYAKTDTTYYVCLTLYDGSNCSYTYCKYAGITTGISSVQGNSDWAIYPSPFTSEIMIDGKELNKTINSVELYDVLGRVMLQKVVSQASMNPLQLNVSALAKGIYLLHIKTNQSDYVQKVIKQN